MSDQIVFTGERRVFFSRKTSKAPESQGEIPASEATKNDKPAELPYKPLDFIKKSSMPVGPSEPTKTEDRRPMFTNSNMGSTSIGLSKQPSISYKTQVAPREKFPDEVPMVFNPQKYRVSNPDIKFEYRRTNIEFRLGSYDQEEGYVLALFIGPDYESSKEVRRLGELCEFDIAKCISTSKPKNYKVIPLTAKSYDRFEGLFFVYLEPKYTRSDVAEAIRCLLTQLDENYIEEACIPLVGSRHFSGDIYELANCIIDETASFLSMKARYNNPSTLKWIQYLTTEPGLFSQIARSYSDALDKVSQNANLLMSKRNDMK